MSVLQILTAVLKFVQTLLGAIPVPAIQDIAWQVMDEHVMVSPVLACILYVFMKERYQ